MNILLFLLRLYFLHVWFNFVLSRQVLFYVEFSYVHFYFCLIIYTIDTTYRYDQIVHH